MSKDKSDLLKSRQGGQALVEFTLSLPILLLLLLAAYFVGAAMYTGTNTSTTLRAALQQKSVYADAEQPMTDFKDYVNTFNTGTFRIPGNVVDTVWLENTDRETAIIVARKTVDFPLFPTFNFIATQGIKGNLLNNNTGPHVVVNAVPFDVNLAKEPATINPVNFQFQADVPLFVPISEDCQPDLSVFDSAQMMPGCTGACRATNTQAIFDAHINHVAQHGGCTTGTYGDTSDVTFNSTSPKY